LKVCRTAGEFFADVDGRCNLVDDFFRSRLEELLMVFLMADLVLSPKFFPIVLLFGVISNLELDIKDISESYDPKFELFP